MALEPNDLAEVQATADKAARDRMETMMGAILPCILPAVMEALPVFLKSFITCITGAGSCPTKK